MKDLKTKEYLKDYVDMKTLKPVNKGDIKVDKASKSRDDVYPIIVEKNQNEFDVYFNAKYSKKLGE